MTLVSFANYTLSLGTILAQVFIVVSVIGFYFFKEKFSKVNAFFGRNGLLFAFLVSFLSIATSLFYSSVAGFEPCGLCWFQRIFMYPLVILLGMALLKKDNHIIDYVLSLSIVGGIISLYHNYIYYGGTANGFCQIAGKGVSCTQRFVLEFGYVTIPMMALTAFALIIILLMFSKRNV